MLVTLERGTLGTGDERAKQVATLAIIRRERTAPSVATERDDVDAVGLRQRGVLALRVNHDHAATTFEGTIERHLHHGALARANRAGDDDVRVGHQPRGVGVEGVQDERPAALRLTEVSTEEPGTGVVGRQRQSDEIARRRPVRPGTTHHPGAPGNCAQYHED